MLKKKSHKPEEQLSLFPTEDSLEIATRLFESKLPITDVNELNSLLAMYHNTLLKELNHDHKTV